MIQFLPQNNVYVYFRVSDDDKVMVLINLTGKSQEVNFKRYIDELRIESFGKDVIAGTEFIPCRNSNEEVISKIEAKSVNIVKIETR